MVKQKLDRPVQTENSPVGALDMAIQAIASIVTSTLEPDDVFEQFTEQVSELLQFDRIYINVLDVETGTYSLKYIHESTEREEKVSYSHSPKGTITELVMTTGKPVIIRDLAREGRFVDDEENLRLGLRSGLAVPLISKGKAIGTLALRSREVGAYGKKEQAILSRLGDLIAPSVEHTSLYRRLQYNAQEMELVDDVAQIITSTLDIDDVYEKFAHEMQKLVEFDRASVHIINEEQGTSTLKYLVGPVRPEYPVGVPRQLEGTLVKRIAQNRQVIIDEDASQSPEFRSHRIHYRIGGARACIGVPLISKDRVIGALVLRSRKPRAFGVREKVILERLASQIAPAVENAELYQKIQEATQEMALADGVARIITSTLDIDQAYEQFAMEMRKLVGFDRASIHVINHEEYAYTLKYLYGPERPGHPVGVLRPLDGSQNEQVVLSGKALVREDASQDARFPSDQLQAELGMRASIAVPLISKGLVNGVMVLRSRNIGAYGPREQIVLERLAMQIAPAIENAELYQRLQESTQEMALVDEVARIITSTLDIDQVYEKFANELKKLVYFDRAFVTMVDDNGENYTIKYVAGTVEHDRLAGDVKPLRGTRTDHVMKAGVTLRWGEEADEHSLPADLDQQKRGFQSSIAVPLISKGKIIGIMGLHSNDSPSYGIREQAILERLANQIAPAMENAELYQQRKTSEEAERLHSQQMDALYSIASLLAQPGRFEEKCQDVLEILVQASGSDTASIRLLSEDGLTLRLLTEVSPSDLAVTPSPSLQVGEGVAGEALRQGQPCVANDYMNNPWSTERGRQREYRSLVSLPVRTSESILGTVTVVCMQRDHFNEERVRLLEVITEGLGMLLENSRLAQDLRSSVEEMAVVDQVARIITSTLDIDEVCNEFAREMRKLVNFERASISIMNHESETFALQYVFGVPRPGHPLKSVSPLKHTITGALVEQGQTIIRGDISKSFDFADDKAHSELDLSSCIALPLFSKGRVFGSMILRSPEVDAYGSREQAILERLASQIAPAIENAQLYDQARSEKELATTTLAQLRAVLSGVDSGILLVDNERRTLWANRKYGEIFGIKGVESFALSHPAQDDRQSLVRHAYADPDATFEEMAAIYDDPSFSGPTQETELVAPVKRILQPFTTPVYDEQGTTLGRMWVYHDITEVKTAEEQILQFQKMESIGRLAGGIAHDFNNLLTAIMGYSQLAMLEAPEQGHLSGHVQEIQKAAERAANLTSQLLAFSRRQVIEPKVINLNDSIINLNRLLRRLIGEDIELVTLPCPNVNAVKVDPNQIEQVLVNLVVNCRDAMPNGGKVIIETAMVTVDGHVSNPPPGEYVVLSVTDTGVGMSEDVKTHLFEPFFTTKEIGKGTGLGLATCYGIVKQSGGHIEITSEPGQGTSVKVYFPGSADRPENRPIEVALYNSTGGNETVLLAEDDMLVRSMVADVLRDQGYTVLQAANGDEALRLAQDRWDQKIDVLVTDLVMPQMGGLELANRLSGMRPDTKIIFTSGYTEEPFFNEGIDDSEVEFIQKPFVPSVLTMKVRDVLDRDR